MTIVPGAVSAKRLDLCRTTMRRFSRVAFTSFLASIRSQEQLLKSKPRDERWPAQDRVKGHNAELEELLTQAVALKDKVIELLKINGLFDSGHAAKAIQELGEYGEKAFGHDARAEISRAFSGPVYQPALHLTSPISAILPLIVLACVGLKRLGEAKKADSQK